MAETGAEEDDWVKGANLGKGEHNYTLPYAYNQAGMGPSTFEST